METNFVKNSLRLVVRLMVVIAVFRTHLSPVKEKP
jgi:hypothetical protein